MVDRFFLHNGKRKWTGPEQEFSQEFNEKVLKSFADNIRYEVDKLILKLLQEEVDKEVDK